MRLVFSEAEWNIVIPCRQSINNLNLLKHLCFLFAHPVQLGDDQIKETKNSVCCVIW
jgi:hypothetical protein